MDGRSCQLSTMALLRSVTAWFLISAVLGVPLEILESSYKFLEGGPSKEIPSLEASNGRALGNDNPAYRILEQAYRFRPMSSTSDIKKETGKEEDAISNKEGLDAVIRRISSPSPLVTTQPKIRISTPTVVRVPGFITRNTTSDSNRSQAMSSILERIARNHSSTPAPVSAVSTFPYRFGPLGHRFLGHQGLISPLRRNTLRSRSEPVNPGNVTVRAPLPNDSKMNYGSPYYVSGPKRMSLQDKIGLGNRMVTKIVRRRIQPKVTTDIPIPVPSTFIPISKLTTEANVGDVSTASPRTNPLVQKHSLSHSMIKTSSVSPPITNLPSKSQVASNTRKNTTPTHVTVLSISPELFHSDFLYDTRNKVSKPVPVLSTIQDQKAKKVPAVPLTTFVPLMSVESSDSFKSTENPRVSVLSLSPERFNIKHLFGTTKTKPKPYSVQTPILEKHSNNALPNQVSLLTHTSNRDDTGNRYDEEEIHRNSAASAGQREWDYPQRQENIGFTDVIPGEVKTKDNPIVTKSTERVRGPVIVREQVNNRDVPIANQNSMQVKYIIRKGGDEDFKSPDFSNDEEPVNTNELSENSGDSTDIISYYEKLKHDIYKILYQVQRKKSNEVSKPEPVKVEDPEQVESVIMSYKDYEIEPTPENIDMDKVIQIIRSFKTRTSGKDVPDSTLYNIAQMIIQYINQRNENDDAGWQTMKSMQHLRDVSLKETMRREPHRYDPFSQTRNNPAGIDFDTNKEDFDYHYVYYDEMGNEYIPELADLLDKHKIISPSDDFTKAFLSKHTSKLSSMLTEVIQSADKKAEPVTSTISPPSSTEFISVDQKIQQAVNPSKNTFISTPASTPTTVATTERRTSMSTKQPASRPFFNNRPWSSSSVFSHSNSVKSNSVTPTTTTVSTDRPPITTESTVKSTLSPATRSPTNSVFANVGVITTTEKNVVFLSPNQLFDGPARNSIRNKVNREDKSIERTEVLPSTVAGHSALETLAGAGAVALMAYGISYALPLAAPLLIRRSSASTQTSPMSRFMNWLESRNRSSKKRRRGGHQRLNLVAGYPYNGTSEYEYYDTYEHDRSEHGGDDSDHEEDHNIQSPFGEDFGGMPFSNLFGGAPSPSQDSKQRTNVDNPPVNKAAGDFYSFGFDAADGAYGDDPPNENNPNFGKVTYEYDFTNTHINPAIVNKEPPATQSPQRVSQHEQAPQVEEVSYKRPRAPGRRPHPHRPKPERSTNIFSDFLDAFSSRVPNHIARRQRNRKPPPHRRPIEVVKPEPVYKPAPKPQYQSVLKPAPQPLYKPAPKPQYKPAPKPQRKPRPAPPSYRPAKRPVQHRPRRPRKQRPVQYHKARPRSDEGFPTIDYNLDHGMDDTYHTYVSLEEVNRLADEEMEGVVKGYNRRYDAPWPPAEDSKVIVGAADQEGAENNVYIFDARDISSGRHLNSDSDDYIYRTPKIRTTSPDYSDFDYVDIRGSSADVERSRSLPAPPVSVPPQVINSRSSQSGRTVQVVNPRPIQYNPAPNRNPSAVSKFSESIKFQEGSAPNQKALSYSEPLNSQSGSGFVPVQSPYNQPQLKSQ